MKSNMIVVIVVVALVIGAGAFYGGTKYQMSKTPARGQIQDGQARNRQGGPNGQGRFANGGGRVRGDIISQDDKSITVKMQDGSSKIVLVGDSAAISKSSGGSKSDLKTGERVAIFGTDNSDGSVTAQTIQLNPMFRGGQPDQSPTAQ